MERRTFLAGTGAVLLAAPLAAEARKSEEMARVGILGIGPAPPFHRVAHLEGLEQAGARWLSLC